MKKVISFFFTPTEKKWPKESYSKLATQFLCIVLYKNIFLPTVVSYLDTTNLLHLKVHTLLANKQAVQSDWF